MKQPTKPRYAGNLRGLMAIGLAVGLVLAYTEVRAVWGSDQQWGELFDLPDALALVLYLLAALWALAVLIFSVTDLDPPRLPAKTHNGLFLGWLIAAAFIIFIPWFHLFSGWRSVAPGPWTQFLVAAGIARFIGWMFGPQREEPFGWSDLALAFSLFLLPGIIEEIRIIFPVEWAWRTAALAGVVFLLALVAWLYDSSAERLQAALLRWRERLGWPRRILIAVILLTPLWIRYGIGAGFYILYPDIRFAAVLFALCLAAFLLCSNADRAVSLESIGMSTGVLVLVSAITRALLLVVDDPFSLSWSEGNRLYDYSLVFGQDLYNYAGRIPDPYNTPGRYGLWGVLFLWQGLPIWVHRLWNVILLTLPSILLAWVLTRKLQSSGLRAALFFWIAAFFIILAPLHPPFMIVAMIVAAFAFHPSPVVRGASLVAASLYAGISRWTWVVAPGVWGALIDLLVYYPRREGGLHKRLLPTVWMGLLGFAPGFLLNIRNFLGYTTGELGTAQQPLLWYRLLPNATLGPGILLLMLLTTGPLIALIIYQISTRQWRLDVIQAVGVGGALLGFLMAGLVISTKIGGGGDLHNLDMYIATLMIVTVLGLTSQDRGLEPRQWPAPALALACLLAFLPVHPFTPFDPAAGNHAWLDVPSRQASAQVLEVMRAEVDAASRRGEVLFMDQRQLLTFGYIRGVPFVPEYEKKYMMDQALASNAAYFQPYYQDLARKRFALIVTEPLKVNLKGSEGEFSDENDLWVIWVSQPTLCFYEPVMTDRVVDVQLLVPRQDPAGCEKFLQQASP